MTQFGYGYYPQKYVLIGNYIWLTPTQTIKTFQGGIKKKVN